MGARSYGREAALQILYALEVAGGDPEEAMTDFWRELPGDAEGRGYAAEIVRGVGARRDAIDEHIRAASTNWRLERMPRVDRSLLRVAIWELMERPDVPRPVIIDEAVDLAKRYGTKDSGAFVNGVLDKVAEDLRR